MLSISDYLALKRIRNYLENMRDVEIKENNGYSNKPVEQLYKMIGDLDTIILKLEEDK